MEIYGPVFTLVCGDYKLIRNSCLMVLYFDVVICVDVLHMVRKEDSRTKLEENYGEKNYFLCQCELAYLVLLDICRQPLSLSPLCTHRILTFAHHLV